MRKVIAAINMTIDGFCNHTAIDPDEEIHYHYANLLDDAGVILYGRTTFQLMHFWQSLALKPSGEKSMDDFAMAIDRVPKLVFSHTLKYLNDWHSASLADKPLDKTITDLRKQQGKDIYVGSRSLINQLMQCNLLDELQLCVHPVVAGNGLPLFEKTGRKLLKLKKTKTFSGGAVILYYERNSNGSA